jgi:tetratricopeptide (TPR) repeat protein
VFHQAPVAGIAGGLFAVWTLGSRRALNERLTDGTALFAFWWLGVWLAYSLLAYQAPRYWVIGSLGLVAAAAVQLDAWWRDGVRKWRRPRGPREIVATIVAVCFLGVVLTDLAREWLATVMLVERTRQPEAASALFRLLAPISEALSSEDAALGWALLLAGVAGLAIAVAGARRAAFPARPIALVAIVLAVAFEAARFAGWIGERKFVLSEVRDAIPAIVGSDAVLIGSFAPVVTLGTGITALSYLDPARETDVFARYGVTHVLMDDRHDPRSFQALYPDLDSRVTFVQSWAFRARNVTTLSLYRVWDAPGYAPTAFERGAALVREARFEEALAAFAEHRARGAGEGRELLSQEAHCRYRLGELEEASRLLEQALALHPDDSQNLQNLARIAAERGDRATAEGLLRRALRADPQNGEILQQLREMLAARP